MCVRISEKTRLFSWIRKQIAKCTSTLYVKAKGEEFGSDEVTLEITWIKAKLFPPGSVDSEAGEEVTYIRVWCPDRPKLEWLLVTNLPVNNQEDALRIVRIYRRRWLIEGAPQAHEGVRNELKLCA